jgi:hypothetical protein
MWLFNRQDIDRKISGDGHIPKEDPQMNLETGVAESVCDPIMFSPQKEQPMNNNRGPYIFNRGLRGQIFTT